MREQLWLSTQGKLDLFANAQARKAALFPFQFQMFPGVYANFADSHVSDGLDPALLSRIDGIFGLNLVARPTDDKAFTGALPGAILEGFPVASSLAKQSAASGANALIGLRTFYPDAGILVARPAEGGHLAVTIKANGNGGHSHNDIGSYAIAVGSVQPVGDPGGPHFYTAATFSDHRFDSKLLNSFGHPVPEINGKLQLEATKVKGVSVVATDFSPEIDKIAIDLTKAYDAPELKALVRTLTYSRASGGSIVIEDNFTSSGPLDLIESLPTHGTVVQVDAHTLQFDLEGVHLRVVVDAPVPFTVTQENVNEYDNPFDRVGVKLHLAGSGKITMRFSESPK